MGDRVFCSLQLIGVLGADHIPALAEAMEKASAYTDELEGSLSQALLQGQDRFSFAEVNYANIDGDLKAKLKKLNLGWVWSWESGGGFGPGIEFFDALSQQEDQFASIEGEICLTLDKVDQPAIVESAKAWARFEQEGCLLVYTSQHELIGLQGSDKISEAQMQLALDASI